MRRGDRKAESGCGNAPECSYDDAQDRDKAGGSAVANAATNDVRDRRAWNDEEKRGAGYEQEQRGMADEQDGLAVLLWTKRARYCRTPN
jgi:hypothetical protein